MQPSAGGHRLHGRVRAGRGRVDRRSAGAGRLLTPAQAHPDIDKLGFAWLPEDDFVRHFARDVDPVAARVIYGVQQPLAPATLEDVMGVRAWKSSPSGFLVAENGRVRRAICEGLSLTR
jgi:hypothetical protein